MLFNVVYIIIYSFIKFKRKQYSKLEWSLGSSSRSKIPVGNNNCDYAVVGTEDPGCGGASHHRKKALLEKI